MPDILTTIQNAASGLRASRSSMRLVSENLANASVDGYHTRSAALRSQTSDRAGAVRYTGVDRERSRSLAIQARLESGQNAQKQARVELLDRVGKLMGNPKDDRSLGGKLASMEQAFQELTADPGNTVRLRDARSAASDAAKKLRDLSKAVQDAREDAEKQISREVDAVNEKLKQVHRLNERIVRTELTRDEATTLKDERARAIDRIAEAMEVDVQRGEQGRVNLYTGSGKTLLDETGDPAQLAFDRSAGIAASDVYAPGGAGAGKTPTLDGLRINGEDVAPTADNPQAIESGRIAGLFEARDNDLVQLQDNLDRVAEDLVQTFQDPGEVDPTTDTTSPKDGTADRQGLFVDTRTNPAYDDDPTDSDSPYPARDTNDGASDPAGQEYTVDGAQAYDAAFRTGLAGSLDINQNVKNDANALRSGVNAANPKSTAEGFEDQVQRFVDAMQDPARSETNAGVDASLISAGEDLVATFQDRRADVQTQAEAAETNANAAADARKNVYEVDQDAQMQRLLELEKTYQANSKVVQSAQRMFDSLLSAVN